jgi:mRNA interferase MazF
MRRGEIWMVDLDPARQNEVTTRRPAVVVSNDRANAAAARLGRGVVTVVPISGASRNVFPFQVFLAAAVSGLPIDAKAQAEQVRSVSVGRLGPRVGELQPAQLKRLDEALQLHLQL